MATPRSADARPGDGEGRQGGRDHGRGSEEHPDRARRGRGHAVRPRLRLSVLHHQRGEDDRGARRPARPDLREEAVRPATGAAAARVRGAVGPSAGDRGRGRRGRGAGDAGGQQAARRPEGRGGEGARLRRSSQGDAGGHRDPHRRPGDQRGPRHQARQCHAEHARPGDAGPDREGEHHHRRRGGRLRGHQGPRRRRSRRRSRRPPRTTTARSCRSAWRSWPGALR